MHLEALVAAQGHPPVARRGAAPNDAGRLHPQRSIDPRRAPLEPPAVTPGRTRRMPRIPTRGSCLTPMGVRPGAATAREGKHDRGAGGSKVVLVGKAQHMTAVECIASPMGMRVATRIIYKRQVVDRTNLQEYMNCPKGNSALPHHKFECKCAGHPSCAVRRDVQARNLARLCRLHRKAVADSWFAARTA